MKEYTKEQMEQLSKYDNQFQPFSTLLDSGYLRNIPRRDLDIMVAAWEDASGEAVNLRRDCGECLREFVGKVARKFREQRTLEAAAAKDAKKKLVAANKKLVDPNKSAKNAKK